MVVEVSVPTINILNASMAVASRRSRFRQVELPNTKQYLLKCAPKQILTPNDHFTPTYVQDIPQ